MHGIMEDGSGAVTTELPVAFQVRTPYRMPDGTNLELVVGLGQKVSVNFIIPMGVLKGINAVIDCAVGQVRVPLYGGMTTFRIRYEAPVRYQAPVQISAKPNLAFFYKNKEAAYQQLPTAEAVCHVIKTYTPGSVWLKPAKDVAAKLREISAVTVPKPI